jgi:hypothetical protein
MSVRLSPQLFLTALLWLAATLADPGAPLLPTTLIHGVTALALGALLPNLAWRFRARGLYGLIALAGVYGLAAVMLFEPRVDADALPRLLVARGLGAQTLLGLLMLAIWLAALRGRPTYQALIAAAAVGLLTLIDTRGLLPTGTLALAAALVVAALLIRLSTPAATLADMALSWRGQGLAALVLVALGVFRLLTGTLDPLALAIAAGLLAFVVALLWFQRSRRGISLLESVLPLALPQPSFLLVPLALIVGAVIGAALVSRAPLRDGLDTVVTAFGIVWLPAMSFAIGARAMLRQVSAEQL